jgi:hypothetical protein
MLAISICSVASVLVFGMGIVVGSQVPGRSSLVQGQASHAVCAEPQAKGVMSENPANWQRLNVNPVGLTAGPLRWIWASSVMAVSSQWSDNQWSAQQVLGAPNVEIRGADDPNAWASLTSDGGPEFIEVGFDNPSSIDEVVIAESFNPGAVRNIDGVTADGNTVPLFDSAAHARVQGQSLQNNGWLNGYRGACSRQVFTSVRVTLASHHVRGWNELDAIGVHPCI